MMQLILTLLAFIALGLSPALAGPSETVGTVVLGTDYLIEQPGTLISGGPFTGSPSWARRPARETRPPPYSD
jgi:hypothetical protein